MTTQEYPSTGYEQRLAQLRAAENPDRALLTEIAREAHYTRVILTVFLAIMLVGVFAWLIVLGVSQLH